MVTKEDIAKEVTTINKLRCETSAMNLVTVFRHGWLESHRSEATELPIYFVDMELGKENLEGYIRRAYPLSLIDIWEIMQNIACGISFLHRRKIIHRDLKPANSHSSVPLGKANR